jgi:hypothetical protein
MTSPSSSPLTFQDPLLPHLVQLAARPESQGAILAGGFGLRVRQAYLRAQRVSVLIPEVPQARATQDLDMFLSVQMWLPPEEGGAQAFRDMLTELGYEVHVHSWIFRKQYGDTGHRVKLDLQARTPDSNDVKVKRWSNPEKAPQVGRGMGVGLAGHETPEGFAVEDSPQSILIGYEERQAIVRVPHPYAWLNLKVRAAYDWLLEERGEIPPKTDDELSVRLKHPFDVYLLTASLTETELEEAVTLQANYREHEQAIHIRVMARELFAVENSPGIRAVQDYARRSGFGNLNLDHELFYQEGLREALGL